MKIYNKNSNVRKPMMYGGMAGTASTPIAHSMGQMSAPMGQGMMKDKKKTAMLGAMKRGGMLKKRPY